MQQFDFEKLDVYVFALEFLSTAEQITSSQTKRFGDLADQLNRAALSILTNLGEGAGEFSPREKVRFYRLSRRSATECAAIVAGYKKLGLADADLLMKARAELLRIVSMLVRLIHAITAARRARALSA